MQIQLFFALNALIKILAITILIRKIPQNVHLFYWKHIFRILFISKSLPILTIKSNLIFVSIKGVVIHLNILYKILFKNNLRLSLTKDHQKILINLMIDLDLIVFKRGIHFRD